MYVCLCNGIRESDVKAAIRGGATKPEDVYHRLGCEPACFTCVSTVAEMVAGSASSALSALTER
jgi:bacterioferritin-associated ferredoxin